MMYSDHLGPDWVPGMDGPFAAEIEAYIRHKRAIGRVFSEPTCYLLRSMDRLFGDMGCDGTRITREMVDAWCSVGPGQSPASLGSKKGILNGFASYLVSKGWDDVAFCEEKAPPCTFVPYIFGPDEVSRLFAAAKEESLAGVKAHSFYTAICLCYTSGLRSSEAANLHVSDFDPQGRTVHIERSKGGVTRRIAVSESAAAVVAQHLGMVPQRDPDSMLLRGDSTFKAWKHGLYPFWRIALDAAGIGPRADGRRQRIHDLRHTFCVRVLEKLAAEGRDIRASLPLLSAYIGHKDVTSTEYYLRLVQPAFRDVTDAAAKNLPDFYARRPS